MLFTYEVKTCPYLLFGLFGLLMGSHLTLEHRKGCISAGKVDVGFLHSQIMT